MKKILLTFIVAITALTAGAQFRYAPVVAYDNTTLHFNQDLVKVDRVSGFKAGAMGELMFPGIGFGIDIGALYSMRGARVNLGQQVVWASDGYKDPRIFLHYLEIPVNLRFKWTRMQGLEDYIAPFVFGGPTFDFLLGHSRVGAFNYNIFEIGLQVGLGFEIFRNWQLSGSFNWGMSSAVKTKKLDNFSGRNRTWSVTLARYF